MPTTDKKPTTETNRRPTRRRIAGERRPGETTRTPPTAKRVLPRLRRMTTPPAERPVEQPTTTEAPEGQRPSRLLLTVAAVMLVAVIVEAVFLVRAEWQAREEQQRADEVASALTQAPARAEKAANALLSYGHDSIDDDIKQTTPFLTDAYAKDYTSTMRDVVAGPAKQTRATVTAKVLSSAVVDAGPERTDVLVFVNQSTESSNSDEPRTALNRAILTMVQRDGSWVVSNLKGL